MAKCPICKKNSTHPDYRPFCSKRCSDVDLQRWLTGGYVLPGEPAEGGEDDRRDDESEL
ncbi:DNA gyrase inhibitor YacG [Brevundimonas poindexterae]|uniref:DNA gyrase inhibitor YacG n=1 Tax=Brevundimonas poindexterae TaxID=74325 RepID=UPI001CFDB852|nr:DNA gyrase inhibitor YacG [Brevundimonas poindexterae]